MMEQEGQEAQPSNSETLSVRSRCAPVPSFGEVGRFGEGEIEGGIAASRKGYEPGQPSLQCAKMQVYDAIHVYRDQAITW